MAGVLSRHSVSCRVKQRAEQWLAANVDDLPLPASERLVNGAPSDEVRQLLDWDSIRAERPTQVDETHRAKRVDALRRLAVPRRRQRASKGRTGALRRQAQRLPSWRVPADSCVAELPDEGGLPVPT